MDFFDEKKWAEVMEPVIQRTVEKAVDRAAEKLVPAFKQAMKDLLTETEMENVTKFRQKGTGTGLAVK